jgi:hypothetical protein
VVKRRRSRPPIHTRQRLDTQTLPQQDEATGSVPNRAAAPQEPAQPPYAETKLPHERDETPPPASSVTRDAVEQARRDLAEGQTDTDNYGRAGAQFDRNGGRGRAT